jgi:hypothetical protein
LLWRASSLGDRIFRGGCKVETVLLKVQVHSNLLGAIDEGSRYALIVDRYKDLIAKKMKNEQDIR